MDNVDKSTHSLKAAELVLKLINSPLILVTFAVVFILLFLAIVSGVLALVPVARPSDPPDWGGAVFKLAGVFAAVWPCYAYWKNKTIRLWQHFVIFLILSPLAVLLISAFNFRPP